MEAVVKVISRLKYILTISVILIFSGSVAYSFSVNNTPEGGYLLCVNPKTKVVTFPNKLSCPTGLKTLELGARDTANLGGLGGSEGPNRSSAAETLWGYRIQPKDVVAPTGSVTKFSELKKVILASISNTNLQGGGNYIIRASISGSWGNSAKSSAYIKCYFQSARDYPDGSIFTGADSGEYSTWSGINLTVFAEPSDSSLRAGNVYLVCATDGDISGLGGYISATSAEKNQYMDLSVPPNAQ